MTDLNVYHHESAATTAFMIDNSIQNRQINASIGRLYQEQRSANQEQRTANARITQSLSRLEQLQQEGNNISRQHLDFLKQIRGKEELRQHISGIIVMRDSDLENSLEILDELTKLRGNANGAIEDGDFTVAISDVWRSIAISSCQIISAIHLNNITISDFHSMEDQRAFNKIVSKASKKLAEFEKLFGEDALRSVFLTVSRSVFGDAYIEYGVQMLAYQIMQSDPQIKKAFDGALYTASRERSNSVTQSIIGEKHQADKRSKVIAVIVTIGIYYIIGNMLPSSNGSFILIPIKLGVAFLMLVSAPRLYRFILNILENKNFVAAKTQITEVTSGIASDTNREFDTARDALQREILNNIDQIGRDNLSPQCAEKLRRAAVNFCQSVDFASYNRMWNACFDYYRDIATVVPYARYKVIETSDNGHVYHLERAIGLISDIDRVAA